MIDIIKYQLIKLDGSKDVIQSVQEYASHYNMILNESNSYIALSDKANIVGILQIVLEDIPKDCQILSMEECGEIKLNDTLQIHIQKIAIDNLSDFKRLATIFTNVQLHFERLYYHKYKKAIMWYKKNGTVELYPLFDLEEMKLSPYQTPTKFGYYFADLFKENGILYRQICLCNYNNNEGGLIDKNGSINDVKAQTIIDNIKEQDNLYGSLTDYSICPQIEDDDTSFKDKDGKYTLHYNEKDSGTLLIYREATAEEMSWYEQEMLKEKMRKLTT